MRGVGGSVADLASADVVSSLRSLLVAIDDGRVAATDLQRAYLEGAVVALELLDCESLDDAGLLGEFRDCDPLD
jgi:hypothetical protein